MKRRLLSNIYLESQKKQNGLIHRSEKNNLVNRIFLTGNLFTVEKINTHCNVVVKIFYFFSSVHLHCVTFLNLKCATVQLLVGCYLLWMEVTEMKFMKFNFRLEYCIGIVEFLNLKCDIFELLIR